jgi:alpha-tubulin suppressor-like RCC1 family protein
MSLEAPLDGDSLFVQVAGRCALTAQGSVYCLSEASGAFRPQTGFGPFASITAGHAHHCGLTEAGEAWCWGSNGSGQLGNGSTAPSTAPIAVTGGHTFLDLSARRDHTCGVTAEGEAWCWGSNWSGETGTSILDEWHAAPVKVRGQG